MSEKEKVVHKTSLGCYILLLLAPCLGMAMIAGAFTTDNTGLVLILFIGGAVIAGVATSNGGVIAMVVAGINAWLTADDNGFVLL